MTYLPAIFQKQAEESPVDLTGAANVIADAVEAAKAKEIAELEEALKVANHAKRAARVTLNLVLRAGDRLVREAGATIETLAGPEQTANGHD